MGRRDIKQVFSFTTSKGEFLCIPVPEDYSHYSFTSYRGKVMGSNGTVIVIHSSSGSIVEYWNNKVYKEFLGYTKIGLPKLIKKIFDSKKDYIPLISSISGVDTEYVFFRECTPEYVNGILDELEDYLKSQESKADFNGVYSVTKKVKAKIKSCMSVVLFKKRMSRSIRLNRYIRVIGGSKNDHFCITDAYRDKKNKK